MLSFHGLALATSLSLGFVGVLSSDIIRVPKGTKRSTNNGCIYIRMILSSNKDNQVIEGCLWLKNIRSAPTSGSRRNIVSNPPVGN
jgi:hypothetical protein